MYSIPSRPHQQVIAQVLSGLMIVLLLVTGCTDDSGSFPIAQPPIPPDGPTVVADLILSPENEVPPVTVASSALGTATVSLELGLNQLSVQGAFEGLTSPLLELGEPDPINNLPSSAHLHRSEPEGDESFTEATGPIVFGLVVLNGDTLAGTLELTEAQVDAFLDGEFYINIHTENNPPGELRAQIQFPISSSDI